MLVDLNEKLVDIKGSPLTGQDDTMAKYVANILAFRNPPEIKMGKATNWAFKLYQNGCIEPDEQDIKDLIAALESPNIRDLPYLYRQQVIKVLEKYKDAQS